MGFHMAGELVGLDGISNGTHTCEAVAWRTATFASFLRRN
jgi:hypothetical protein